MKKVFSFLLALALVFSLGTVVSPQSAQAATDYCNSSNANGVSYGASNVRVYNGNLKSGACHIDYYHQAAVGKGSTVVDGVRKSQFSRYLTRSEMASVAGQVVSPAKRVKLANGNYKAEYYVISMNSYVRVIYYTKVQNGVTYRNVVSMYPISKLSY